MLQHYRDLRVELLRYLFSERKKCLSEINDIVFIYEIDVAISQKLDFASLSSKSLGKITKAKSHALNKAKINEFRCQNKFVIIRDGIEIRDYDEHHPNS